MSFSSLSFDTLVDTIKTEQQLLVIKKTIKKNKTVK